MDRLLVNHLTDIVKEDMFPGGLYRKGMTITALLRIFPDAGFKSEWLEETRWLAICHFFAGRCANVRYVYCDLLGPRAQRRRPRNGYAGEGGGDGVGGGVARADTERYNGLSVLWKEYLPLMREGMETRSYKRVSRMFRWAIFLITMIISWPQGSDAARVFIDINSPPARKIRLAIPEFRPSGGRRDPLGLKIAQVIESDLKRSGLFFIPDRKGYLENPLRAGIRRDEQRFSEWSKVVRAEALIKGGYTISGKTITAEVYLYDTHRSAQELGKRYRYPRSGWRLLAHRFANAVLEAYTGEKGVFDTQIAFVSRRSLKERGEIYIMDWDGAELRRVDAQRHGKQHARVVSGRKMDGVFFVQIQAARRVPAAHERLARVQGEFFPRAGRRRRLFSEFALLRVRRTRGAKLRDFPLRPAHPRKEKAHAELRHRRVSHVLAGRQENRLHVEPLGESPHLRHERGRLEP